MQFSMINTLVRKFYMLKNEGFLSNDNYKEDLKDILSLDECVMFNTMFENDDVENAIDNIKRAYASNDRKKQYVVNILTEPKITQIVAILLRGSNLATFEKAIHLRENIDKSSIIFVNLTKLIENKILTYLISRVSKFPTSIQPENYLKTLAMEEIHISNVARYFGGEFEKAYLDDNGIGVSYYEFVVSKVLIKYKFMDIKDARFLLLQSIWNAIPAFKSKTRVTSVGSVR